MGLPQAGELQLVVAAVALQLSLPAQSVQKGPSFREGPHRQQEQGPQRLEPQLAHGLWVAQQLQWEVWAGSLGAGLVAVAAAAGASAGSAAVGPSSRRTSAAPCGRLVGLPGAVASGTLAARAKRVMLPGPGDLRADVLLPTFSHASVPPRLSLVLPLSSTPYSSQALRPPSYPQAPHRAG